MNIENLADIIKFAGCRSRRFCSRDISPTRERETFRMFNRYLSSCPFILELVVRTAKCLYHSEPITRCWKKVVRKIEGTISRSSEKFQPSDFTRHFQFRILHSLHVSCGFCNFYNLDFSLYFRGLRQGDNFVQSCSKFFASRNFILLISTKKVDYTRWEKGRR